MTEDSTETIVSPEDTLVKQLAAPILKGHKRTKRFNSRNRAAWKRMNRPDKTAKIDKGAEFINSFLARAGI